VRRLAAVLAIAMLAALATAPVVAAADPTFGKATATQAFLQSITLEQQATLPAGVHRLEAYVRTGTGDVTFLAEVPKIFDRLRRMRRLNFILIFLEANNAALVRRFSETRRPHPMAPDRSVSEGIRDEREKLRALRQMADEIVDTSDMTVHELRQFFMALSRGRARGRLVITLLSFGYKNGIPVDADLVFDVRCLPNPYFVAGLRRRTGRDRAVVAFMEREPAAREFIERLEDYLRHAVPYYIAEGKSYLTIAIGCTGGRHRSVMIAERLRKALQDVGARVRVRHRDVALS